MWESLFVFFIGAVIGSFLNVCIHRMPLEQSIVTPGSHCPNCKKNLQWFDNIPLFGYILLNGKCRYCKKPISIRYFIVELFTAITFIVLYGVFGLTLNFFMYTTFICGLIVASFIDIPHRIIPDEISVGGVVVGFIFSCLKGITFNPLSYKFSFMIDSFFGILAGGGIIYLTGKIFDLIYFKILKNPPIQGETESMGGGDVKLLAMIGAFLGWKQAILTFFLAPFFGAAVGIFSVIFKKDHTIPYGPFLALAAIISMFYYPQIISMIFVRG